MKIIIALLFAMISFTGFSQQMMITDSIGSVTVRKDIRLDILAAKQAEINHKAVMMNITHASGYRIQVINTQSRDDANNVKTEMLRRFPEQKTYLLYKAPNFKVRVGNFLTQREAEPVRKMIAALYPARSIFLVSDRVEYRPIDEESYDIE
ncbi:MAG: SPOR domain-containing protein [Chitinophagaceae bacterium]|nr:SPOR domain-containing protein [Chitinophagaceae bacterium]